MVRNKSYLLRKSWIWEGPVTRLIDKYCSGFVINVPCGESDVGDLRIDIDANRNPDIVADMRNLPIKDNTADTVIRDPPWKINYYQKPKQFFELVRICKDGGSIIFNATWIPESKFTEVKEVYVRRTAWFGLVSVISIFKVKKKNHKCIKLDEFL